MQKLLAIQKCYRQIKSKWICQISEGLSQLTIHSMGMILVKMNNAIAPIEHVFSVNTYSRISTVPRANEQAREQSKRAKRATKWPVQNANVSD